MFLKSRQKVKRLQEYGLFSLVDQHQLLHLSHHEICASILVLSIVLYFVGTSGRTHCKSLAQLITKTHERLIAKTHERLIDYFQALPWLNTRL